MAQAYGDCLPSCPPSSQRNDEPGEVDAAARVLLIKYQHASRFDACPW
jgi:hypothetical protein